MASRRAVSGRGGAAPAPATFAAYPSVVHFGGYKVGQPCTATVRIVNVSGSSAKCDILGPAADEGFSMQHALRVHDRLPPGIGACWWEVRRFPHSSNWHCPSACRGERHCDLHGEGMEVPL